MELIMKYAAEVTLMNSDELHKWQFDHCVNKGHVIQNEKNQHTLDDTINSLAICSCGETKEYKWI